MSAVALLSVPPIPEFAVEDLNIGNDDIRREVWRIDATIPQLAYLSHNFFRYYGKFPSVLARKLIERYSMVGDLVLDNMVGCGTTMVEASLLGRNSIGYDINPLAVLSSNVKTNSARHADFRAFWKHLLPNIQAALERDNLFGSSTVDYRRCIPAVDDLNKWFAENVIRDLASLKALIDEERDDDFRAFLTAAFAAIIRRVSRAFDGEVRPHVNKHKRQRSVIKAFSEKVLDMLDRLQVQDAVVTDRRIHSKAYLWDARLPRPETHGVDLIISHPPYLNCFNYVPVYRWEMLWLGLNPRDYSADEVVSWPAKPNIMREYYEGNREIIQASLAVLRDGGRYCIIIGDCTIHGVLEQTHLKFLNMGTELGLRLETIIYRDTYYATGRYAYSHRAEYNHGVGSEDNTKRDAILVMAKPA